MGIKNKHTLKVVFCQFAISLIVALAVAIILPFGLETLAINIGLATRANQSELQVKKLMPVLTIAPDITKVVIPQECGYLILDKDFKELFSNMDEKEKEDALLYAKGEYIEYGSGKQFVLVAGKFYISRYADCYFDNYKFTGSYYFYNSKVCKEFTCTIKTYFRSDHRGGRAEP